MVVPPHTVAPTTRDACHSGAQAAGPSLMLEIGTWTDPSHENHKPFAKGPGLAMHAWYLYDKPSPKPCSTAHMQKLVHVYFEALHENETDMSNNPDQGVLFSEHTFHR